MKVKTVLLLVVAVVCGTAASRLSKRLFSGAASHEEQSAEKVVVLAAKQPLAAGTLLNEPDRLFEERTIVKSEEPARAVPRLHQLRGRRLAKALDAQAIVTADYLVNEEGESQDQLKREGRQAVAVPVQPLGSLQPWPQSRVDVIWTATAAGSRSESRVIAQDLPLLGVQVRDAETTIATLAAKRDDADKLTQAATQGKLRLVLRHAR